MGAINQKCCRPFLGCEANCTAVDPPEGVTGTVPGAGAVSWIYSVAFPAEPFSCDYILNECFFDSVWTVYEEGQCESPFPSVNLNNTRYAVGTSQTCLTCDIGGPSDYTLWFEEWQVANRVKSWYRRYWKYRLAITAFGTDGTIKIELRISYGYCFTSSQTVGVRNRMKEVTVDCNPPTGVVTSLSAWQYAPTLDPLIEPEMCVSVGVAGCYSETTADSDQTCTTSQTLAGYHRSYSGPFGGPITCTDSAVYFNRLETDAKCNGGAVELFCRTPDNNGALEGIEDYQIVGVNSDQCGAGDKYWVKYIDCADLYAGAIVLDLLGGSVGGSITSVPSRQNPAMPNVGFYTLDCEFTHTPDSITLDVPDTISLTFT